MKVSEGPGGESGAVMLKDLPDTRTHARTYTHTHTHTHIRVSEGPGDESGAVILKDNAINANQGQSTSFNGNQRPSPRFDAHQRISTPINTISRPSMPFHAHQRQSTRINAHRYVKLGENNKREILIQFDRMKPPTPGGFFFLGGFQMNSLEEEESYLSPTPNQPTLHDVYLLNKSTVPFAKDVILFDLIVFSYRSQIYRRQSFLEDHF